jgi:hypothetical protein
MKTKGSASHRQRIELCGVRVDVETDHAPFAAYLGAQFPDPALEGGQPDVAVRLRWTEGPRPVLTPAAVFPDWPVETRLDRNVFAAPGRFLCLSVDDEPRIAVASAFGEPVRRFEVRFHFTLGAQGWRESAKRALRRRRLPALRRLRLSTLAYYAVYYPVWWHLEASGAAHPLHAAGVAVHGRGLLLGGLPGCGKSTLATAFLGEPDGELLSDNVVVHDERQIHGCFEPLLLDAASRARIGAVRPLRALGRRHVHDRDAFHAPHRVGGVPIGAAVVLARGPTTRLVPLPARECARMLLAINEAAKEVRRYHVLAAQLALVERDALGFFEQRVSHLERLLAGVPCYWLEVREGAPAEAVSALRTLTGRAREAAP